jgi:hypothetical protein
VPDENKLKAMAEAGYEIAECCATCLYRSGLGRNQEQWGACAHDNAEYDHARHNGLRELPSHRLLRCENYTRTRDLAPYLGDYAKEPWKGLA